MILRSFSSSPEAKNSACKHSTKSQCCQPNVLVGFTLFNVKKGGPILFSIINGVIERMLGIEKHPLTSVGFELEKPKAKEVIAGARESYVSGIRITRAGYTVAKGI